MWHPLSHLKDKHYYQDQLQELSAHLDSILQMFLKKKEMLHFLFIFIQYSNNSIPIVRNPIVLTIRSGLRELLNKIGFAAVPLQKYISYKIKLKMISNHILKSSFSNP